MPLSEQTFYILLSLAGGPLHGYAILKEIEQLSQGRMRISVSTLYTALKRLLESGWIERLGEDEPEESDRPRKIYQLTPLGRQTLGSESRRLKELVQAASQRLSEDAV
jgi:PadR family transcriptional regulator, regulatory protein PadR